MRVLACLLLAGCVSSHVGIGVIHSMTQQQERRDPNPTAPILDTGMVNVWAPEQTAPVPGSRTEMIQRTAASIAAIAAGAIPALVWYGTFDENRLFQKPQAKPEDPPPEQ